METKSGGEMETQSGSDSNPNRTLSVTLSPEMDSRISGISEFVKLFKNNFEDVDGAFEKLATVVK